MSLWKYLEVFDWFRVIDEYEDKKFNQTEGEDSDQYPNYNVLSTYDYRAAPPLPGYYLLIGGSYAFLASIAFGIPLVTRKYRNLGYRDFKLLEMMCLPMIKCTVGASLAGIAIGGLFEVQRVANEDLNREFNKKVL